MTGELFARVVVTDPERNKIREAIATMESVRDAYGKTGLSSVQFLIEDLNDGISALKGVLEELYY